MELEGQWWRGQLATDIHQAFRYKELKLPSYKGHSPQLSLRRYFADLIAIVSNRLTVSPRARHLAVYLLDLFMDRYDISIQQLHLVALSCLLLASQFEEKEESVPKLEQLNSRGCLTNTNLVLTKQERVCLAHDNDVKEANKQRGQAGPQSAQLSVFQATSQPSRPVHFQQPQYLHQTHQTTLQYRHPVSEQPSCQQIVSTTHTSSYTLQTSSAGFQTGVQGLGHVQTGVGMSLAIPVEVKPCLSVSYNRSYQINEHYPCITPCFER
ncbi:Cyclin-J [Tupaia chinensis]|uniref:Cyclin-J n=1 Tax=Tupaia chinensis TaxID=246437 RepID=L8Y4S1_TUPCH|nr:Cyclin-J [Tupaia chinensis]